MELPHCQRHPGNTVRLSTFQVQTHTQVRAGPAAGNQEQGFLCGRSQLGGEEEKVPENQHELLREGHRHQPLQLLCQNPRRKQQTAGPVHGLYQKGMHLSNYLIYFNYLNYSFVNHSFYLN